MNKEQTSETVSQYMDRKDFMKQVGMGFGAIMFMQCIQGCTSDEIPDPNPGGGNGDKVDTTLDLNSSTYTTLNKKGGSVLLSSLKIVVAQTTTGSFIAVSSVCTHENYSPIIFQSNDTFRCPNHDSIFTSTGAAQSGPATKALKKYNVSFDQAANTLRIFE